ncbi:swim zinc finger domain-containing protein : SWIM zinc finger-containing protein OS=Singulisphaera acidiphila (strain ATCC BAA-1392 / DSM 18658 / VKM B-2454 / MOB10) GN=Sinac_3416 PE=4 SV=1 [Gemmata massiliana]|uniref:Swim zinc finger domain-containing protein: SWIM zinc finger-containing protein n=1 Tax=Gemmata massiliana TaxID=1210884 RepID=A0A6P2DAI9_9BACT|nr:SWIM zinc finger family protein [Gemmata massiliana]VTR97576.1 swim zinc finger domain-containing protein : SWIM zinc finger-containing protein OS=Singulisphaera acidiphila (strain ATCC BAA-1392 / DSM 18658 / VKM B-2454 / MOB10) GN=Sinac_3416 PE=4 SV=1 [Gemmata massiliana]
MATTEPTAELDTDAPPPAPSSGAHLSYAGASRVLTSGNSAQVEMFGNLDRAAVRFDATIKNPLRFREALSALYGVIGSDYRYAPKDRTQYIAYLRLKRDAAPLGVWHAQQAYFAWMLRNDPTALTILDPVVSVHPDQITFEVFGKDESTYACLAFRGEAFDTLSAAQYGTTNIDFSDALYSSVQQIRGYRETKFAIGHDAGKPAPETRGALLEKKIQVPDSWLRGFLQVQSAATLPFDHVQLSPMDLYNVLRHLRMNGDRKGKKRGLRFELVPAQQPRIVAEPWETVFTTTGDVFRGKAARLVRVWGRRRLMTMKRLLPFVQSVDVYLLGSGLPSFWVFRCGDITLTLGLTGFTSANWSSALGFDLLLPRKTQDGEPTKKVVEYLGKQWKADAKELAAQTGVKGAALVEAVQVGCQNGELMYDIANGVYRHRPLTAQPLDLARLQFRNLREKVAHDLLTRRGAVRITGENRIAGIGLELTGTVTVTEEKRDYRPQMVLADEGQVRKVTCTCAPFRKQGIKGGPCVHLIALRLAFAEKESKKAKSDDAVKFETRAFAKRDGDVENVVQISLERDKIKYRWGLSGQTMRLQTMRFNSEADARQAYFAKLADLDSKGYLDAIAE